MEQKNMKNFNMTREIYNLFGSICLNTDLLRQQNIEVKENDFMQPIHKTIFMAINNIIYNASGDNVKTINAKDIDNYLSTLPMKYKIWNDQKGMEYINKCIEHANEQTFRQSYDRIKKMSALRAYHTIGMDVSDIYEWDSDDYLAREKSLLELDKMSLNDIFQHFTLKNLQIKDQFNIETNAKQFRAGSNVGDMLDRFKEGIEYGYPFKNGFENYLLRGMRKGKYILRSGATGTMKTSLSIADMCNVAVNKYYDKGKWNFNGTSIPSLFISTELDEDELNTIVLAHITGIPRRVIQDGEYTKEQEELLREAGSILKASPFYLVHIPDFSISDIEDIIERHILDYDVQYVTFDYIQNVPKLSRTVNQMFGSTQREDQILYYLSASLKTLAERYEVFIESSTQLNNKAKEEGHRDASALRGSSAVADKIDAGMLLFRAKESDREKVKEIINENFHKEPNFMRWLYKNRSGQTDLIIWSYMNFSTVREEVLFVTDYDYNIVEDIDVLNYTFKEGLTERELEIKEKVLEREEFSEKEKVFGDVKISYDEIDFDF